MGKLYLINFLLAFATTVGMTISPLLTTEVFGASVVLVGLIEGGAEFLSNLLKLASGSLFDGLTRKRKVFTISCFFALTSKCLLFFLSPASTFFAKITERIANGMFSSPRDAYAAIASKKKALALGLMSCTKTAGCVTAAIVINLSSIYLSAIKDYYHVFIVISVICTFIALNLSILIQAPEQTLKQDVFKIESIKSVLKKTAIPLWLATFFFLARFNDGMIMLFLKSKGFEEWYYSATIGIFNFFMFFTSPILGYVLDKKMTYIVTLITGASLLLFNAVYYLIDDKTNLILATLGLVFWGIQRVGSQLVFATLIFSKVEKKNFGTAIGMFSMITGFCVFLASIAAGKLADYDFKCVFICSGLFAALFLMLAMFFKKEVSNE